MLASKVLSSTFQSGFVFDSQGGKEMFHKNMYFQKKWMKIFLGLNKVLEILFSVTVLFVSWKCGGRGKGDGYFCLFLNTKYWIGKNLSKLQTYIMEKTVK